MDASEDTLPIRPPCKTRKSVSFTDETELVDTNGEVTMAFTDDSKDTAQSHSPATPPLSEALNDFADQAERATPPFPAAADDADPAEAATIPALDEPALDLSMMKKKKKKVKKVEDDFTAKLKALEVDENEDGAGAGAGAGDGAATATADGDMFAGTGIWAHDETRVVSYDLLVSRFYVLLNKKIPDHTIGGTRSKIPPPQCLREGNKKTIFANIADICKRMKRSEEHVTAYLFAELGTNGSVDGSRRLVIKGKFTQKMIEGVVRKYILEYVTCKTCRSGDTELSKGENRLYFITCNSCGSRRSVAAVKTGFSAQIGRRKKQG